MNNVRVCALAEKYNIPALKDLAKAKFTHCQMANLLVIERSSSNFREYPCHGFEFTENQQSILLGASVLNCANANMKKGLKEEALVPVLKRTAVLV